MRPIAEDEMTMPGNADAARILTAVPAAGASRFAGDTRDEDPFGGPISAATTNLFGAFSVQQFADVGSLTDTHGDAAGFLAYPEQFAARNFWYRDAGVKAWAYRDELDDWEDTYGLDAVRVAYHSGHGATGPDGVFRAPMGAAWHGRDVTATSDDMRLGDGHARYVFWSCSSALRVAEGHSPMRTWSGANAGVRMMFGFDDDAFDSPLYGTYFWRHWRGGESISSSWLNACWDIADDHTPVAVACGRNRAEAQARLDGERHFEAEAADTTWWQWRWYSSGGRRGRELNTTTPANPKRAVLAPLSARRVADLGDQFDVDTSVRSDRGDVVVIGDANRRLHFGDGMVTLHLGQPNHGCTDRLSRGAAVSAGGEAIRRYGLDAEGPLVLDRVLDVHEAGGQRDSDVLSDARTVETIVQYRQFINGIPIISSEAGLVRVSVGNDGVVTKIQSSTRAVVNLADSPGATTAEPGLDGERAEPASGARHDALLATALGDHLRLALARGGHPLGYSVLPGTREIGYHVHENTADLIAAQAVELEYENGYRSRIWVWTPLSG